MKEKTLCEETLSFDRWSYKDANFGPP